MRALVDPVMELKRLTTQYHPSEDRVRLTGLDDRGQTMCLWFTQRLLNRLVPALCEGLDKQLAAAMSKGMEQPLRSHVEQSFAQQLACAALPRHAAGGVRGAGASARGVGQRAGHLESIRLGTAPVVGHCV